MPETSAPSKSTRSRATSRPRFHRRGEVLVRREPDAIVEAPTGQFEVERRDRSYRRALLASDLVSFALALVLSIPVLGEDALMPAGFLVLPLVVLAAKIQGLYDRDELLMRKTTLDEAPQLFGLATMCTLGFWLLHNAVMNGYLGNKQVLLLWGSLFTLAVLGRGIARMLAGRYSPTERCLFIGDARAYDRLQTKLADTNVQAELVGRMNLQRKRSGERVSHASELRELIGWTHTHRIIIEPQVLPADEMLDFVRAAKSLGVRVSLLPRVLDVVGSSVVFDELDGMTVLGVRRFGLTRSSRLVKRTFDLAGAGVIMLFAAPVMALIALLIKLDSPGPVLFRQTRIGRDGQPFQIMKFRTMDTDAEERKAQLRASNEAGEGLFKIAADPRITRVGRLLRKTSLDELSQLLNVVKGDMSLVGPRPLVVDEDEQITGWDRRRLQLTPGMTGPWQVAGSSRIPLHEMVKIDYLYVAGWSLWADMKILLRTVPYVVTRRGM